MASYFSKYSDFNYGSRITLTISPEAKVKAKLQGFQICMVSWVYLFIKKAIKKESLTLWELLQTSSNF